MCRSRILTLMLAALAAPAALANEIVVPTDMPLSVAVASAVSGDTITLLPSGSPYQQFPGLSVSGKTLTIRGSTGNPADVVLDGAALDIVLRMTNADGSVLQDLTIRNGRGGAAVGSSGAGLSLNNSDVTLRNCIIRDNVIPGADGNGVGIYGTASSVRVEGCVIENNTCPSDTADGGGIYFNLGNHVIVDTVFRDNGVPIATAIAVGSIGGGFYADTGTAVFTRCRFEANRAGLGGAIGVSGTMTLSMDACTLADNAARQGAGFYITSAAGGSASRLRNSLFVGNTASVNDVAIYTDKPIFLTNLTIVNNTATGSYVVGGNAAVGTVLVDNCILWGNTYNLATGLFPVGTPELVRRCILQQAFAGAAGSGNNQVIDPQFVDAANRDFQLMPTSPAIDAGDASLYFGPFSDLQGGDRGVDDPATADTGFAFTGPMIDIGALELQVPCGDEPGTCDDIDFNNDGVYPDFVDLETFLNVFSGAPCP